MGYYVETMGTNAKISAGNLQAAYEAMCAINETQHDKKHGGGFVGHGVSNGKPQYSQSVSPDNTKWFSWMEWNYDETCDSAQEILDMLGFDTYMMGGDLIISGYSNKMGQEELFFQAAAPFIEPVAGDEPSYIEWRGDEGEMWRWEFHDGELTERIGVVRWE